MRESTGYFVYVTAGTAIATVTTMFFTHWNRYSFYWQASVYVSLMGLGWLARRKGILK